MRRLIFIASLFVSLLLAGNLHAGNEQRAGEAGAVQLLINPWAGSAGWNNSNMSSITGLEALYLNVAGTAFVNKFDLGFTHTNYLSGADININNFGFTSKVGEAGALTAAVSLMSFGDIKRTTVEHPDGTGNTFSPKFSVISAAYSRQFSNAIYGGAVIKLINESIDNVKATGVAIDAGIQYITGERDNFRFGVSMQNVGPTMKYSGNGLSLRGYTLDELNMTFDYQSAELELPSLIRIGLSNDFLLMKGHNLTVAGTFTSNSFTRDQYSVGVEYNIFDYVLVRGGYCYEKDGFDSAKRQTVFTGLSAGATVQIPLNKERETNLKIDYSYRDTNPFGGVHSVGVRVTL
jgi:hypothetical protein